MFTGLIEEVGHVVQVRKQGQGARLVIEARQVLDGVRIGDSISISGACQTVVEIQGNLLHFDTTAETLRCSTLGDLHPGEPVNLERALSLGDRLGGHLVQGHVDGVGALSGIRKEGISRILSITAPDELIQQIVLKGSITVDGISLTVSRLGTNDFEVSLIPETIRSTTLELKQVGDRFNLETDLIGKYVRRFLEGRQQSPKISMDFLSEHGFS
jgi:riboflavin synthase